MDDRLLKLSEVAARVNFTRQWIYKLMRRGQFPRPIKIGSMQVRWRESDIDRWIAEGGVRPKSKGDET